MRSTEEIIRAFPHAENWSSKFDSSVSTVVLADYVRELHERLWRTNGALALLYDTVKRRGIIGKYVDPEIRANNATLAKLPEEYR